MLSRDLYSERMKASFVVEELTSIIYGKEANERRKKAFKEALSHHDFDVGDDICYLDRKEYYERGLKCATQVATWKRGMNFKSEVERRDFSMILGVFPTGFSVHHSMFVPTLKGQGTKEQQDRWLPLAVDYRIIGSYAQTELGHGTNVRGIETTATYDPKTEEFILNSPTVTSTKFWAGGMGKTATHVVLIARLITLGKDYGPHAFIVQLRSLEDHTPLPGVTVGDIGPKMGYAAVDNGFLQLNNVRIPRMQMLMKNFQVSSSGEYSRVGSPKLIYGTMIFVRAGICRESSYVLSMAVTIAIRYSAVRRQTQPKPGAEELQLLDYQTQQYKLFSLLAAAYAGTFVGDYMLRFYRESMEKFSQKDFDILPELHATSAGMKALLSDLTASGIEVCRRCCGGHGYLAASGLPSLFGDYAPATTYEGDNTVLFLQTARYLLKCAQRAFAGEKLPVGVMYLVEEQEIRITKSSDLTRPEVLIGIYQNRAKQLIKAAASKFQSNQEKFSEAFDAWNASSVQLVACAKAHCQLFAVKTFIETAASKECTFGVQRVLKMLATLQALHGIVEESGSFLQTGALTPQHAEMALEQTLELLKLIRPEAVALVDAFDLPDFILRSVLGRYDGDVYTHLLRSAKNSPLNKQEVSDGYYKYLRPLLKGSKL